MVLYGWILLAFSFSVGQVFWAYSDERAQFKTCLHKVSRMDLFGMYNVCWLDQMDVHLSFDLLKLSLEEKFSRRISHFPLSSLLNWNIYLLNRRFTPRNPFYTQVLNSPVEACDPFAFWPRRILSLYITSAILPPQVQACRRLAIVLLTKIITTILLMTATVFALAFRQTTDANNGAEKKS